MAFYKSKFTGQEIDARLTQGTYDDAVKAGFKGTKEEFYALLGQLQETTDAATISQPAESDKLATFNKNIVDAINELHTELQLKPDKQDVIDQEELETFKDEIAAEYTTKEELNDYALKSELPDTSEFVTTEALDTKADKTELENVVKYTDISDADDTPRKTIMLDNNDTLSAYNTTGTANNIAMISKWDVVNLGSTSLPINLNGSKERPTYNDDKELALVSDISDPYEINLTNLLSAEDSESISTVIGGIDNLNATVQDNRIIVGTISNGSVSVSIRILGNVTTLYYLLDSVVGLTLNEVKITNTSGTLSKSVTTHSVLTENMVINSLDSDETTLPLSAAQGKVLATNKQDKIDESLQTTDKTVAGAINEVNQAVKTKQDKLKPGTGVEITSDNTVNVTLDTTVFKVVASLPESPAAGDENKIHLVPAESTEEGNIYTEYVFVNGKWEEFGTYRSEVDLAQYLKSTEAEATYQKITDSTLATTAKTIVGAINEVKSSAGTNTGNVTRIDRAVGKPVIEDIDLTTDLENGYYWTISGVKTANANYSIKYVNLSKGDLLIANAIASSNIALLTVVDNTHTKAVQFIDSVGAGSASVKVSFLADRNCIVAISCYGTAQIGDAYAYIVKSPFNIAISDNSYMQYLHKVYESYGAVYNDDTGYWEMFGLTDLTEEDMYNIWYENTYKTFSSASGDNICTILWPTNKARIRFLEQTDAIYTRYSGNIFSRNNYNLEVFKIISHETYAWLTISNRATGLFFNCRNLRDAGIIDVNAVSLFVNNNLYSFNRCAKLNTVLIKQLKLSITFQDSPLLSYKSIKYLVDNAANTKAITVTVHPTTYSYLTGTAQPTEEVGGTTEEWQALVTTAQGKQISFAVPEETQSEVTE